NNKYGIILFGDTKMLIAFNCSSFYGLWKFVYSLEEHCSACIIGLSKYRKKLEAESRLFTGLFSAFSLYVSY
ncbi:MAG: hypothetical protein J7L34_08705, partial [Thermotogaceae bacterium]|nr:hypothetical protein [Thermotogaceae bacterium]